MILILRSNSQEMLFSKLNNMHFKDSKTKVSYKCINQGDILKHKSRHGKRVGKVMDHCWNFQLNSTQ